MKGINCKFLMVTLVLAFLHAGCCCADVSASDNAQVPPPKVPDMRLPNDIQKALNAKPAPAQYPQPTQPPAQTQQAEVQVQQLPTENVSVQPPQTPSQMEQKSPQEGQGAQGGGFMSAVLNMLTVLAKVVLLILGIAGVYFAYNKLKSQVIHIAVPKEKAKHGAPATVSEAVASYARHRLRKGY